MTSKFLILAPVAALAAGLSLPVLAQGLASAPQPLIAPPAAGAVQVQILDANATPVSPAPVARRGERHADADGVSGVWQRFWHDDDDEGRGHKGDHHDDDDDDDDDEDRGGPQAAPAGSVAPPKNGLFVPGGAPAVVTK